MPTETHPLSLKEQWIVNTQRRRQRILDGGGMQFNALIDGEHTQRLQTVLEQASMNKREWLEAMIDRAFAAIKPPSRNRRGAGSGHSNERPTR